MAVSAKGGEMTIYDSQTLDVVFGKDSVGDTPEERALTSSFVYIRSQGQVAKFESGSNATGLKMSAKEAYESFGMDILLEAIDKCTAVIFYPGEPATSLRQRRLDLNLTIDEVANLAGLSVEAVQNAENPRFYGSIHPLVAIAKVLGLNHLTLGFKKMDVIQKEKN